VGQIEQRVLPANAARALLVVGDDARPQLLQQQDVSLAKGWVEELRRLLQAGQLLLEQQHERQLQWGGTGMSVWRAERAR
jgi:hypothetical protein